MSIRNRISCAFAVALLCATLVGVNFGSPVERVKALTNPETIDVIASGLNNPRGLNFGPDGALYVAEAGSGGAGPRAEGPEGIRCYGTSSSISRIDLRSGAVTRVATGLSSLAGEDGSFAIGSNGFRVVEKQLDPKHPFHEMPLWRVSDRANKVVEAFLASDKTCRLLTLADIPQSSLEHENPSMGLRFSNWVDLQQADLLTRAISEGDASGDGIDDALAIVVRGDGDQKLYSVICFNGRKGTGYNPAPFWIVKDSSDFIGKAYVEAESIHHRYKYRTPPTVYVVYDLDFYYQRADNDFYTWNGAQYEQDYFVTGEHVEGPDEVKLFSQPNATSKVVKVVESDTTFIVLSAVSIRAAGVEVTGRHPADSGRVRWYRVQALKKNRITEAVGFVAGDHLIRWAEEQ